MSPETTAALVADELDVAAVERVVREAIAEDLMGGVDVTSVATIPFDAWAEADLVPRQAGVVAGLSVAAAAFEAAEPSLSVQLLARDGDRVEPGQVVLTVSGLVRGILTGERTALNLVCHLSGVATLTRRWVDAVEGTGARVRDTRKTTPGLRFLEKHAVRAGGGVNHRMGLSDAALVKDNHVVAAGGVVEAFRAVRETFPGLPVEVECDTLEQVRAAVDAGADLVLADNMGPGLLREVVAVCAGRARVEASGGLTLDTARAVAETGVDYLSVGALTHSAPVLDLGLDLRPAHQEA